MRRLALCLCVSVVAALALAHASQQQDPQKPTFRSGVSLVRVDAYPMRDGKIIEGLRAADFEVLEDGVPQKIESFQFVQFPQSNPAEERRDPNSQREGFQLAADPTYRVFVIYLDNLHVDFTGSWHARVPLITFLNRVLGPKDLFGVLTTKQSVEDLMLGQQTLMIEEQLTKYWDWGRGGRVTEEPADLTLRACFPTIAGELISRRHADEVFSDLEGIATKLADIREERKNILIVSNGWRLPGSSISLQNAVKPQMPQVGVSEVGKLTLGSRRGEADTRWCQTELQRLSTIDFQQRLRELLALARRSNVTFYSLKPAGLVAAASVSALDDDRERSDALMTLSHNTDGIAVVNTNDLTGGARRIADELAASYVLGYYPTNTKSDGRLRKITVRLKATNVTIRARREYRAPTAEEMASLRAATAAPVPAAPVSPADMALAELKRLRPAALLHTRGTVIGDELLLTTELTAPEVESGRWKEGGDVQIMVSGPGGEGIATTRARLEPGARAVTARIALNKAPGPFNSAVRVRNATAGDAQDSVSTARTSSLFGAPLLFRSPLPSVTKPAASVYFRRTERMQIRWPVTAPMTHREARVLGRDGVRLELAVSMSEREEDGARFAVVDLNLAPLTAGEYIMELKGTAAGATESAMLAFRVFR
ncbi:MAG: VWA domain-containing protein [Acidobacteria bacterium]|nr:VWA domain-containing protein [Acidobacteriota bacterium]